MYREDEKLELTETAEEENEGVEPNFDEEDNLQVTDGDFSGMSVEEDGELVDDELDTEIDNDMDQDITGYEE